MSKPEVSGDPQVYLDTTGNKLIVHLFIISEAKPTCSWACGGMKIRKGGRFFTNIVQKGNQYELILEVDEVSVPVVGFWHHFSVTELLDYSITNLKIFHSILTSASSI